MIKDLHIALEKNPVIMAIYGIDQLKEALSSNAKVCIIANIDLIKLKPVIEVLKQSNKIVIINIDSCNGLQQDSSAIEYLMDLGVSGLLSTRLQTIQKANKMKLLTIQKIFVTDRSAWTRSLKSIEQSTPDYVQLMPSPILSYLSESDKNLLPPIIASGFVCNKSDINEALMQGATAISSSDIELW